MFNLADYQTVAERLEMYWKDNPDGRIETELVEATANRFIVKASIFRTEVDPNPWATGLAFETVSDRGVNSTSALENCESSALGRALANAGYSPKGDPSKRASREEMEKVARVENDKKHAARPFAEKLAEKITVAVEDDPWTIKTVEPAAPAVDAVQLVKDVLGGKTQEDIPNCQHGEMIWKTGVSQKTKKPWGQFRCKHQGPSGPGAVAFCDPIWYMISEDGSWKPQVKW